MTEWQSGSTLITRLRVRGSGLDPILTQLRITSLFNSARLDPSGLAPSAIVFIRKLRDPLPGALQLRQGSVPPPLVWEQAVTAALDQLVRRAARPALGAVPANAEAVIFLERSELLACLASDWCDGSAVTHWWWQSLFRQTDLTHAVVNRTWFEAPEYIPAALECLAEKRQLVPFVRVLHSGEARRMLQVITHRFVLYELQSALGAVFEGSSLKLNDKMQPFEMESETRPLRRGISPVTTPQGAPWQRWVPESQGSGMSLEQQCLLGIGLMLHRAPGAARSPAFAPEVLAWLRTASVNDDKAAMPAINLMTHTRDLLMAHTDESGASLAKEHGRLARADTPSRAQTPLSSNPAISPQPTGVASAAMRPQPTDIASAAIPPQPSDTARAAIPPQPTDIANAVISPQLTGVASVPAWAQEHPHIERVEPLTVPAQTTPPVEQTYDTASLPDAVIDTGLGGLFYLINLGLFLDLYGDFTTPAQPGIALSIWDFVALLGRQLVGEGRQQDPLWLLLARLAGRSGQEEPGNGFDPPHAWRLPEEWLEPFPESGLWQWEVAHGRLWVQHPEQFWVLDVPRAAGSPIQQLQDELQTYRDKAAFELRRASPSGGVNGSSPLERWLGWLMSYVRARLRRALGVVDADELRHVLCEHQGRVYITPTHMDIALALEALPIAIRLAGLDRNPGWVPAAGRYIAFHFA